MTKNNKQMVLFVDGHGFVGSLQTYIFEKQKPRDPFDMEFVLNLYSMDILCIFGVVAGLYVPFKVRLLKGPILYEINIPGYVKKITETDKGLRIFVKTKLSKLVIVKIED